MNKDVTLRPNRWFPQSKLRPPTIRLRLRPRASKPIPENPWLALKKILPLHFAPIAITQMRLVLI